MEAQRHPVESISAVTLLTVNMLDAVAFYQALGFHLLYGGPEAPFTSFRVGTGYLNLQLDTIGSPRRAGWGRPDTLVYLVFPDVDAIAAEFGATRGEAHYGCDFELRDPDGNRLRIAAPMT